MVISLVFLIIELALEIYRNILPVFKADIRKVARYRPGHRQWQRGAAGRANQ